MSMEQEFTYDAALGKSVEWQHKADQATTAVLKSAFETVALEYKSLAAEIRAKNAKTTRIGSPL